MDVNKLRFQIIKIYIRTLRVKTILLSAKLIEILNHISFRITLTIAAIYIRKDKPDFVISLQMINCSIKFLECGLP